MSVCQGPWVWTKSVVDNGVLSDVSLCAGYVVCLRCVRLLLVVVSSWLWNSRRKRFFGKATVVSRERSHAGNWKMLRPLRLDEKAGKFAICSRIHYKPERRLLSFVTVTHTLLSRGL